MKNKIIETKIDSLIPDDLNANKGTEYGQHLIETSLSKFGAGRSILIDKNNKIIAGNKTVENAGMIGLENVIVVETDGKQIVAVKRTDIDLDSTQGRELAIADNASAKANIEWDQENIAKIQEEWEVDPKEWGINPDIDYSDKNKEINTAGFEDEMIIKLKYTEQDYKKVRDALSLVSSTPEQAVWKLLNL